MIIFTKHARNKFEILKKHKFAVSENQVLEAVSAPDLVDYSRKPLLIAQRKIDRVYVLRVVYQRGSRNYKNHNFLSWKDKAI